VETGERSVRLHLVLRDPSAGRDWLASGIAVVASMAITGVLILLADANPVTGFVIMFKAAFVGKIAITETLARAAPILLTGLAAIVALRVRVWNIGAEGQLLVGAMAAAFVGTIAQLPAMLLVPAMILAAMLAGGLAAAFPALLKNRFRVNEVVSTLMLNFIIANMVTALLSGPWRDPVSGWPDSPDILAGAEWPTYWRGTNLHLGVVLAVIAAVAVAVLLRRTTFGLMMDVVGDNPVAASHARIDVRRTVLISALLSGALAGLAGAGEVGGIQYQAMISISSGYGYAGLIVAMLARLSPLAAVPAAIFLASLMTGSDEMSRQLGVPSFLADAVQGIALLAVLIASQFARYRIVVYWGSRSSAR